MNNLDTATEEFNKLSIIYDYAAPDKDILEPEEPENKDASFVVGICANDEDANFLELLDEGRDILKNKTALDEAQKTQRLTNISTELRAILVRNLTAEQQAQVGL